MLGLLFATLWQGAIISAVTATMARCVPKRNAATHYVVWFIALLALVVVPLAAAFSHIGSDLLHRIEPASAQHAFMSIRLIPVDEAQPASSALTPWILAVWAAGACVQFARLIVSFVRIAKIRRNSAPLFGAAGDVHVSGDIAIPIAAGVRRPCIIIPAALAETLSGADLERIIAHERAHIRRNDILANAVQRCIEAALYFNPCAWIIGRQVTRAREAACDDLAVHATGDEEPYVRCLARLMGVAQKHVPLATPSAIGSRHALVDRIERLMSAGSPTQITPNYYTIGGIVIVFAALTLALQAISPAAAPVSVAAQSPQSNAHYQSNVRCENPNAPAMVSVPAPPRPSNGAKNARGWATIRVTVAANGKVTKALVDKSSGNAAVNEAALAAAEHSTFTPKMLNCKPVPGTYLFKVTMDGH